MFKILKEALQFITGGNAINYQDKINQIIKNEQLNLTQKAAQLEYFMWEVGWDDKEKKFKNDEISKETRKNLYNYITDIQKQLDSQENFYELNDNNGIDTKHEDLSSEIDKFTEDEIINIAKKQNIDVTCPISLSVMTSPTEIIAFDPRSGQAHQLTYDLGSLYSMETKYTTPDPQTRQQMLAPRYDSRKGEEIKGVLRELEQQKTSSKFKDKGVLRELEQQKTVSNKFKEVAVESAAGKGKTPIPG